MKLWDEDQNTAFHTALAKRRYADAITIACECHIREVGWVCDNGSNFKDTVWPSLRNALHNIPTRTQALEFMWRLAEETTLYPTPRTVVDDSKDKEAARFVSDVVKALDDPIPLLEALGLDPRDPFYDRVETGTGPIAGRDARCQELGSGDGPALVRRRTHAIEESRRDRTTNDLLGWWGNELHTGMLLSAAHALPHVMEDLTVDWHKGRCQLEKLATGIRLVHVNCRTDENAARHLDALPVITDFIAQRGDTLADTLARLDTFFQRNMCQSLARLGYSGAEEHVRAFLPVGLAEARETIREVVQRSVEWRENDVGLQRFVEHLFRVERRENQRAASTMVRTRSLRRGPVL